MSWWSVPHAPSEAQSRTKQAHPRGHTLPALESGGGTLCPLPAAHLSAHRGHTLDTDFRSARWVITHARELTIWAARETCKHGTCDASGRHKASGENRETAQGGGHMGEVVMGHFQAIPDPQERKGRRTCWREGS